MMYQGVRTAEKTMSDEASERIQTLSKNLFCEAIILFPGMFIPNTQSFQKTLLLILFLHFMACFSDEKSLAFQGCGLFVF